MRRIALWNTAFLGDAVLTLPLLQSLQSRYPQARIDYYVRKGLEPLFSAHPAVAAVYGQGKRGGAAGLADTLATARAARSRRYDLWISAHTSPRSGLVALASRAPMRIGYARPALNRLFYTHRVDRRFSQLEEIERLLELLNPLGPGATSHWPELTLPADAETEAQALFADFSGSPVLGMHPGSVWGTKRWPAAYFAEIGIRAVREGAWALLFAGKGEEAVAQEVKIRMREALPAALHGRLRDYSGALSLPLLAACLGRLSCYLTNDSGPMHLAWTQRTPVTALFGPTVRALGFFPRGEASTVCEIDLPCRPCGLHGPQVCPLGHHHCMTLLAPDLVWPDVRAKLIGC
jgi:heptosyltransferase-2